MHLVGKTLSGPINHITRYTLLVTPVNGEPVSIKDDLCDVEQASIKFLSSFCKNGTKFGKEDYKVALTLVITIFGQKYTLNFAAIANNKNGVITVSHFDNTDITILLPPPIGIEVTVTLNADATFVLTKTKCGFYTVKGGSKYSFDQSITGLGDASFIALSQAKCGKLKWV